MVKKASNNSDLQSSTNTNGADRKMSRNDTSNFCIEKIICYELKNVSILNL